jgi:hypothetical protein
MKVNIPSFEKIKALKLRAFFLLGAEFKYYIANISLINHCKCILGSFKKM